MFIKIRLRSESCNVSWFVGIVSVSLYRHFIVFPIILYIAFLFVYMYTQSYLFPRFIHKTVS